jgi:hypothetical protein
MARTVSAAVTLDSSSSPAATTDYTLFTVPAKNTGLWNMMYVISTSGNETPSVKWYDDSTGDTYLILSSKNLGAGEYVLLSDAHVALQENDKIIVSNNGTTDSVTYIATIELRPAEAIQFHS